jgi:hypothetical protein
MNQKILITSNPKFDLGEVVITTNANKTLAEDDVFKALARHVSGDWGEVCKEDWKTNDNALKHGERLLSEYTSKDNEKFWIITEWDRSVTTVLLPEDY